MLARTSAQVIEVTPTLDTNAYASGDRMGSIFEIPFAVLDSQGTALLISLVAIDKDAQGKAFDVMVFEDLPVVASADNAAISIADDEMDKLLGEIVVASGDWKSTAANKYACIRDFAIPVKNRTTYKASDPDGSKSLWGLCVAREGVTHTAAGLVLKFGLEQD
jgi:hypothetical protein